MTAAIVSQYAMVIAWLVFWVCFPWVVESVVSIHGKHGGRHAEVREREQQ